MTVILIGFVLYYAFWIIHDLFFDKSGEVVEGVRVEEQEVDIQDTLKDFHKFNAADDVKSNAHATGMNSPAKDSSDTYEIKMSGGIEIEELEKEINACEETGDNSLFDQMMISIKKAA